jgi:hypothetical protein
MKRLGILGLGGLFFACGPNVVANDTDGTTGSTGSTSATSTSPTATTESTMSTLDVTTVDPDSSEDASDSIVESDINPGADMGVPSCGDACGQVDVLFVVDNSSTMAPAQRELARAAVGWIGALLADGSDHDVQIMVTTTDMGNPLCTPFQPAGYDPANGAPTTTGCNARIDHFTGLGANPLQVPEACTDVCPSDIVPSDPFLAFGPRGANVPEVPESDIDGDGNPDSPIAQSLACMIPQGINGCGFESPLEAMLQALNPNADWNVGDRPFMRDGARLVIVMLTDEADCSVDDYTVMENEAYFNDNPNTGTAQASSALCWNAGVECEGPDAMGVYSDCTPVVDGPLEETDRYVLYLRDDLVIGQDKRVDFLSIGGVPTVTEYDDVPPYAPTAGGLFDLVVRNWQDGVYPAGDILPDDDANGIDAADKHFTFGIGPGCTGEHLAGGFTQAIPNPRVQQVCQALEGGLDSPPHCFMDSICAPTFDGAMTTLAAVVSAPD